MFEITRILGEDLSDQELRVLYQKSGGWPAGAALLLQESASLTPGANLETVFDYFAVEVFARLAPPTQNFLLKTACLPYLQPAIASRVTGYADAAARLDALARDNGFITRRADGAYCYHDLFREFLQARAQAVLTAEQYRALLRAAGLLVGAEDVADASRLLAEAEAWDDLAELLRAQAPALVAQGQYGLLEQGLRRLPPSRLAGDPRLLYWLGTVRLPFDMAEARGCLEPAYRAFRDAGELADAAQAWATIVDSYALEFADFSALDGWIAEAGLLAALPEASRGPFAQGMFTALMCRQPDRPDIPAWAEQVERQLRACADPGQRIQLGSHLAVYYLAWLGRRDQGERLLMLLQPPDETCLAPVVRLMWLSVRGWFWLTTGETAQCLQTVVEAVALATQCRLRLCLAPLLATAFLACLGSGDLAGAHAWLERVRQERQPARRLEEIFGQFMTALYALHQDDAALAVEHACTAAADASRVAGPQFVALIGVVHAFARYRLGEAEAARQDLQRVQALAAGTRQDPISFNAGLLAALMAREAGDADAADEALRRAFALGRRMNCWYGVFWPRPILADLCAQALAAGIEPEYINRLIRTCRLPPPAVRPEFWPWPLRIYCLGCVEIVRDGQPLTFTGKAQQRPLALLKVLIARGGRGGDAVRLAAILWPEAEGHLACGALETNRYRLRRLLGFEQAVTFHNGILTLNPDWVWTDVEAFEQFAAKLELATTGEVAPAVEELAALSAQLLELYQGDFLGVEASDGWALACQQRLRAQFRRSVVRLSDALARLGAWRQIIELCEVAQGRSGYTEEFCRRVMEAYGQLSDTALVIETYRQCQRRLALSGAAPTAETTALYRRLLGISDLAIPKRQPGREMARFG